MLGIARTTAVPGARLASSVATVTPAAMDRTRVVPASATSRQTAGTSAGFTARTVPVRRRGPVDDGDLGEHVVEHLGAGRVLLDHHHVDGGAPGAQQPADEGLAHLPAPDHLQHGHGPGRYVACYRRREGVAHPFPDRVPAVLPAAQSHPRTRCIEMQRRAVGGISALELRREPDAHRGRKNCSTHA